MKLTDQVCNKKQDKRLKELGNFRPIPGYEGLYEVTSNGIVKAVARSGSSGGVLVPAISKGYGRVILSKCNKRKNVPVHRLVAIAWLPNPNNLPVVNHKDGDKSNNHVDNLEWCDHKWNCLHSTRVLGNGIRESNGRAKLTEREVQLLRYLKAKYPDISSEYVGQFFGMAGTSILMMWHRKNWSTI